MSTQPTVLIIEDDPAMLRGLKDNFEFDGYRVLTATDGDAGVKAALGARPDLVVLDVMLPKVNGYEVCRFIREEKLTMPVLMLTAKGQESDIILGLKLGADDYVTKPFSVRELLLRVRAVLRRAAPGKDHDGTKEMVYATLRVDPSGHRVWVADDELSLTALEFKLLTTLLSRCGRVQTRDTLLTDVWGMQTGVTTRTVDTHVTRLRKKLGEAGNYIETLRGVGYRFRSPDELEA